MMKVTVFVLGFPEVQVNGVAVAFPTRKALALLAFLAVERAPVARSVLTAMLWPESASPQASAAFRRTLSRVRSTLQDSDSCTQELLHTTRDSVMLHPALDLHLDVHTVHAALHALPGDTAPHKADAIPLLEAAVQSYRSDFLMGFSLSDAPEFDTWVSVQRETWHQRMSRILERLAQLYQCAGNLQRAIATAQRWVAHDPLDESAHRALISAHTAAGDRAAALRAYDVCRTLLSSELGLTPEPATEALVETLRTPSPVQVSPARPVPETAERTRRALPSRLPVVPKSIIGREAERAAIRAQLCDESVRLLTLTGPPGVGKTCLALTVLAEIQTAFPDGVWFVDLTSTRQPDAVLPAIAMAVQLESDQPPSLEALIDWLHERRVLLILDNFEHVLEAALQIMELLLHCSRLAVLVTSRAALGLRWEQRIPVAPLALPPNTSAANLATICHAPATQLFVARARTVNPGFALTDGNAKTIAALCIQLDGLPLAIELAAAHTTMFSPQALLARLSQRLPLPDASIRDLPERHRSLHAAIASSYALLSEPQQAVLRRLAVFLGNWSLEAAQEVVDPAALGVDLLATLITLTNQGLVQADYSNAECCFRLLETIRTFAWQALVACNEEAVIRQRHAHWFAKLAEEIQTDLNGSAQANGIQLMLHSYPNIAAAIDWSISDGELDIGLRLCVAMGRFWDLCGWYDKAQHLLGRVLDQQRGDPQLRARAHNVAGNIAIRQGMYSQARQHHEAARELFAAIGDKRGIATVSSNLGATLSALDDLAAAAQVLEQSLALWREFDEPEGLGDVLTNLGVLALSQQDYAAAERWYAEALAVRQTLGNPHDIGQSMHNLGQALLLLGRPGEALALWREVIAIMRAEDMAGWLEDTFEFMAWALAHLGHCLPAARLWGAAERLRAEANVPIWPADQALHDQYVALARAQLDSVTFATEWAAGRALSLEEMVEAALASTASTSDVHAL